MKKTSFLASALIAAELLCAANNSAQQIPKTARAANANESAQNPAASIDATIAGRVTTASGRGVFAARVTITNTNGESRSVQTNIFGYYRFADVPTASTYLIAASAKNLTFNESAQVLYISGDAANVDFAAR